jgi:hypothetical protein
VCNDCADVGGVAQARTLGRIDVRYVRKCLAGTFPRPRFEGLSLPVFSHAVGYRLGSCAIIELQSQHGP